MTLADLSQRYLADYETARKSTGPKRPKKLRADHNLILEFFGSEILIEDISREQCRQFRDLIAKIPSNISKLYPKRAKSLQETIEDSESRELPTLSYNTQDNYIRTLRMLFSWAKKERLLDNDPTEGLAPNGRKPVAREARLSFSIGDLKEIFSAPLFTGCENDGSGFARPGQHRVLGTRAWVILIGCFTGARLNEICQLRVDDFEEPIPGKYFIRISDSSGRRVKNATSRRLVPIHPELIRLRIHELVERAKNNHEIDVFFDLPRSADGYRSERFSRWFNEGFTPKIGNLKSKGLVFHSFRHTFRDAMRNADISTAIGGWICGWNEEQSAGRNYGSGPAPAILFDAIQKVSFEGLDLSHLLPGTLKK